MSYNLFQGGIDMHRRRKFLARLAESRQRLNRAVRAVEERVRLAWNALLSARQRLKALRAQVQANERVRRSEEHTSELQSLMRISYAVFCLKKKKHTSAYKNEKYKDTDMTGK